MDWYKNLSINQKINLKSCFKLICGASWIELSSIFSMKDKIELIRNKLEIEGFDVD
tara:strand:- start:735 stop:902 length:168 start_codon:yes stop_codon:yes gene_type:complete